MTFLALVAALIIEQARALPSSNPAYRIFRGYARSIDRSLNGGTYQQGVLAWLFVVAPIVLGVSFVSISLTRAFPLLGLLFNIAVLYLTMGFRQFSHAYSDTLDALRAADIDRARANITRWTGSSAEGLEANELARLAIERGLFSAHRHVFGVIFWFACFGAGGAVFFRLAAMLRDHWGMRRDEEESRFGVFSAQVFGWCDWIPARFTAVSFAVVGDFEDALYCWRTQAPSWPDPSEGIVLASGAGAIGVRLGSSLSSTPAGQLRAELGTGEEADAELMTSAIGLIWRSLVLWLFVVLVVSAASWLG